jgi:hypothetical protein
LSLTGRWRPCTWFDSSRRRWVLRSSQERAKWR